MKRYLFVGLLLTFAGANAGAQARSDSVYARAQALVGEGHGAQGRALVDSIYRASRPGSAERAEALFWRAALAATAADAERDYRAIVVDYATSPRVEDALLRLAQLELTRGDREAALRHLQRLAVEFPASAHRARTAYWIARVHFDRSDLAAACTANAEALARVAPGDVELRNQIEYQQQQCRGLAVAVAAPPRDSAATVSPPQSNVIAPPPPRDVTPSIPAPVSITPAPAAANAQMFSVQVAATSTRAGAQSIATRMSARGYDARVDGTSAPFRVRIGRYATRAAAARALAEMKSRGIDGFVAAVGPR